MIVSNCMPLCGLQEVNSLDVVGKEAVHQHRS